MKKTMVFLMALVLCLSMMSFTAMAEGGKIDKLNAVESQPPATLNPTGSNSASVWSRLCYETLYGIDGECNSYPLLADATKGEFNGYDHEAGTGVYDLYLYDYITDNEGNSVTAEDVVKCYETALSTGRAGDFSKMIGLEAVDTFTVRFTFTEEITAIGALFNYWNTVRIYADKAYQDHNGFATELVATGRYIVTDFKADVGMTLVRRADYWQKDESLINPQNGANIGTIHMDFVKDASQQIMALRSGSVDLVQNVSVKNAATFNGDPSFVVNTISKRAIYTLYPNVSSDSVLNDINLRNAVFYSIDSAAITQAMGNGVAVQQTALAKDLYADYNPAWAEIESAMSKCDNALAKEYLAKSSYNGETIRILYGNFDPNFATIGQIIQVMLLNNGINCELAPYDMANFGAVHEDSKAWELWITNAETFNSTNANLWFDQFNYASSPKKLTSFFAHDEVLQGYLEKAVQPDTHTSELMDEAYSYLVSQLYCKPLCSANICSVYKDVIDTCVYSNQQNIVIQSCSYK